MTECLWTCNTTWPSRYDDFGVTGYTFIHTKRTKKATVIDVGCSTGEAMYTCQQCMLENGVELYTIGIDMSEDVRVKAEENLDQFIFKNICDVYEYIGEADVVICVNAIRDVPKDIKGNIVRKCAEFLKPDGVLITDVNKQHKKMLKLEYPKNSPPEKVCPKKDWRTKIYDGLGKGIPSDTRMMNRNSALSYANNLESEWKGMHSLYKKKNLLELWWKHKRTDMLYKIRM